MLGVTESDFRSYEPLQGLIACSSGPRGIAGWDMTSLVRRKLGSASDTYLCIIGYAFPSTIPLYCTKRGRQTYRAANLRLMRMRYAYDYYVHCDSS